MRKKQKHFSRLLFQILGIFLIGITFGGCEAEKDFLEESDTGKQLKRDITFEQFKREIGQPRFSTRLSLAGSDLGRSMEDFEIDTTQVKALERTFIVYSMKLDPMFIHEDGKFYNLFVYKDNTDEIVKQIIEFLPTTVITGETEQEIYNYLQNATKELIYSSKVMNTSAICISTGWVEVCNCMGHTRDQCGGCSLGFHWNATITYENCGSGSGSGEGGGSESSDGSGVIADPVLPTPNKDNCNDLKIKSYDQEFKVKMNELKADASGASEKAYTMFNGNPKYSPKYSGTQIDPSGIQIPMHNRVDCTGFMHCHMNNTNTANAVNYAVFTPDDFITFRDLVNNIDANNPTPLENLTMYVTSDKGTYAIKITDYTKFDTLVNLMINRGDKFLEYYYNKIKLSDPPATQVNEFLKMLKNENGLDGIELYKCDANYQNWEQQILDANNNTKPIKC